MSGESGTEQTPGDLPPVEETRSAPTSAAAPDEAGARMPRWVPRLMLALVLTTLGTLAFVYALGRLTSFIGTLVVALFASFALEPAVNWLARHGWKRGLATMVVMLITAILVAVIVAAMVPLLLQELQALILAIPGWVARIDPLLQRWFGTSISEAAASTQSEQLLKMVAGWGANLAGNLLGLVAGFVGAVFQIFTVALFAFYLIADGPRVRRAVLSMVRPRTQREVLRTWDVAIEKTGGYLYSRMLLAAVSALFTFVMMTILRLPFAIPLAIFVGIVSQFIPTVGTYIAAALPVLLALLHSPTKAIALLVFFVVYQQIENYLLAPRVTAHTMNMHAAVAFGSVIVGAALFGALGAFLAIPGAAILQALLWTSLSRYEVAADGLTEEMAAATGSSTGHSLWQHLAFAIVGKRRPKKISRSEFHTNNGGRLMTNILEGIEPASLWRNFETLTTIPRPSRAEEAAIAHVHEWAARNGLEVGSAGGRNVLVRVPATPGRESAPTLILQGHLDMVCERRPDSPYDPVEGRIRLVRDGDWLTADGTTLGADDGAGVAAMMAIGEDRTIPHGPLELLMTVAEEVGLEGAKSIEGATLSGRMMLNLDSEEDGRLTVGCAGSTDTFLRVEAAREAASGEEVALVVVVSGGKGGHSGINIAQGHSNAVKVLACALRETLDQAPFRLASLDGGKSRNAIPRDARAVCLVPPAQGDAFRAAVAVADTVIRDAFAKTDPDVQVAVESADLTVDAWSDEGTRLLLDVIAAVPNGLIALSPDFEGLVETSTSLGVATTEGGRLELHSLTRTSNESALPDVPAALSGIARLSGGSLEVIHGYAGWRPNLDSPLLATAVKVYEDLFGGPPIVTAVHAGLETALVGEKVAGLDMLSIGPQIEFPHSPGERVSIPTVARFWQLLVGVLDALSR